MTVQERFHPGHLARLEVAACAAMTAVLAALALVPAAAAPAAPDTGAPAPGSGSFSTPPAPVGTVDPEYPEVARALGIEGRVLCAVTIDETGVVVAVEVAQSASPMLDEAAQEALRHWTFSPALQRGQPVASRVMVPVLFALNGAR